MKISGSIYSDKVRPLKETIDDLVQHKVDLLHVDCNDDLKVFDDIKEIRNWTDTPIDLHIITDTPEKYFELLRQVPVEYVTFQYENLSEGFKLPNDIQGKKGLAVITPTSVEVFDKFSNWDFILIMATIPGQSGGVFDALNFAKIRHFRKKFPNKSIHVDNGLELTIGYHFANNIFAAIVLTTNWQAFQTDALFMDTTPPVLGWEIFLSLFLFQPLFFFYFNKKYKWGVSFKSLK
ncbi:hypothetical protein N8079_03230 [Crocinitomicaceae bacterium]|nr:hypothetical protein [Crocinitomicaceae bacterium]